MTHSWFQTNLSNSKFFDVIKILDWNFCHTVVACFKKNFLYQITCLHWWDNQEIEQKFYDSIYTTIVFILNSILLFCFCQELPASSHSLNWECIIIFSSGPGVVFSNKTICFVYLITFWKLSQLRPCKMGTGRRIVNFVLWNNCVLVQRWMIY